MLVAKAVVALWLVLLVLMMTMMVRRDKVLKSPRWLEFGTSIPTPELGSPCGTKLGGFTIFSEDSWRTEGTGNSQGLPCFPEQGSARPHPATHAAKFRDGNTLPQLLLLVHGETMHGEHGTSRCPDRQQLSLSKSRSQRFD